jgi:hypothetical protein
MPLTDDRHARSLDRNAGGTARVYFARRASDGAIKIGASTYVRARLQTVASAAGEPVELIGTALGGYRHEAELHRDLAADRIGNSEWYRPTAAVLARVERTVLM